MIDPQTVGKILDAAQIVDVVSDFVTLRKRGVNYLGLCPFHDEKTGSFTVSPAKGIFKCFGCGKGGSAVHFIMEHEQLDYPNALRYLAKKYNIEIVEKELTQEQKIKQSDRESLFALNDYANRYFQNQLHEHQDGQAIGMSYFRARGFSDATIRKFQLGYCLDESGSFAQSALKEGYKNEFIEKSGLCARRDDGSYYDRFKGRVIFPVHTLSGKVVAFGGRILKKNDKQAKYVNSPESEIYHKSNELYGIFFAKQNIVKHDRVFLVEGYTDVISMHQAGIENVVASSGTALTPGQIKLIHRFTPNITVLYDGDNAGIKASIRGIDLLLEEGMNVKVVLLPEGEDPDSFAQSRNADEFIDFIDKNQDDFLRFKTRLLMKDAENDPIKKSHLIHDIIKSISLIPDPITQGIYVKECSQLMDVKEKLLLHEIEKLKKQKQQERLKSDEQQRRKQQQAVTAPPIPTDVPPSIDASFLPPPEMVPLEYSEYGDIPPIPSHTNSSEEILYPSTPINSFEKEEKNILEFLVRYGERFVFSKEDLEGTPDKEGKYPLIPITVGEYIIDELNKDNITFRSPLHKKMLDIYENEVKPSGLHASIFYVSHPDYEISRISADLISDRYQLSKIHRRIEEIPPTFNEPKPDIHDPESVYQYEQSLKQYEKDMQQFEERQDINFIDWLGLSLSRVIFEYIYALFSEEYKELVLSLNIPENVASPEKFSEITKKMKNLHERRKGYADILGIKINLI